MIKELAEFIKSNPDARELKRAITVKMWLKGYRQREIQESLSVSSGFISKWTAKYAIGGTSALKLAYRGSAGYLRAAERAEIIKWLPAKKYWNLGDVICDGETYVAIFVARQQRESKSPSQMSGNDRLTLEL